MTTETLKSLIEHEYQRASNPKDFKAEVFRLIDLYESENTIKFYTPQYLPCTDSSGVPDKVPYGTICSCNPANGGSGICGCIMGNQMVDNPKKYGWKTNLSSNTTESLNQNFTSK